ncbi:MULTISPECIES: XdhC family protein [Streptomyces]|uniref:XdhC family protein n=1 Tax=Streptomyces TaxID=1883 RepID=UPI00163BF4DC|nr:MULTISPECIES: XdhC/CoxI family protein [Streptomyces]MBC2877560.1 XdhC family protein [Streptomyces sp. TYQ1024]UBI36202.1 XdhC family protein [Streptomyces mobaraensis]UKW28795.1 XdhC family protein [Streptomyces sp. TYQ1024]
MLDLAEDLHRWCAEGRDFAVATVAAVHGSAPRQPGAALAVDAAGTAIGSVSGGCVEGAVYELCREALESGSARRERFGYSDEDAFAVGLTCGGVIEVLITPVRAADPWRGVYEAALSAAAGGEAVALVRSLSAAEPGALLVRPDGAFSGSLGAATATADDRARALANDRATADDRATAPAADRRAADEAAAFLVTGRTGVLTPVADGAYCGRPAELLIETSVPPPRLIVFGAIDFAAALARVGKFLGHHVTVCDARPVFATRARFPDADEVVVDWPHRYLDGQRHLDPRTAVCVLTHDEKFDIPLLVRALRLPLAYVGAMGSHRTHHARLARLRAAGLGEAELSRLRSPIGLDLGGRTPEETALSIAAEIVAVRRGGSGTPLRGAGVPIHREVAVGVRC